MADGKAGVEHAATCESVAGARLLCLVQTVSVDGSLSTTEATALQRWLDVAPADGPASHLLVPLVRSIVLEGSISRDVRRVLYGALDGIVSPVLHELLTELRHDLERAPGHLAHDSPEQDGCAGRTQFILAGPSRLLRAFAAGAGAGEAARVLLQRERGRARSPDAMRVLDRSGRLLGRVPETSARPLAMLLDRGYRYVAEFRIVGDPVSGEVPVVAVAVYRPEARADGSLTLAETVAFAGFVAEDLLVSRLLRGLALAACTLLLVRACT